MIKWIIETLKPTYNLKSWTKVALAVFLICFPSILSAQNQDLRDFQGFFNDQVSEYQYWLEATSLNQILTVDSTRQSFLPNKLKITRERVTLYLKVPDYSAWEAVRNEFKAETGNDIETELLDYFRHLMDLKKSQAEVVIIGDGILIKLFYSDGTVQTKSTISKGLVEGSVLVNLDSSKFTSVKSVKVHGTARFVKEQILSILKEDLSRPEYRPRIDADKFQIKVRVTSDNFIEVNAMNLTKRVIPGNLLGIGFYETLDYRIQIKQDPDKSERVELKYIIRGKYGSGWFAPKNNRYKPMAPRFQSYLNNYINDFRDQILSKLQK